MGTVFGGSIFGALDPIYMVQLINILGKDYVVWDKEAKIKFLKPIKKTVFARFLITDELLNEIRKEVSVNKKIHITLPVSFVDKQGTVFATVEKLLFISDRKYYKSLTQARKQKSTENKSNFNSILAEYFSLCAQYTHFSAQVQVQQRQISQRKYSSKQRLSWLQIKQSTEVTT